MFCPNCGTQNPETAATCTKCNFNLKGAAAPKFKGTMLMMNNPGAIPAVPRPPTPAGAAPPPGGGPPFGGGGGEGAPLGNPAPMPSKLKGTMVGVAPPMGIPPTPPRPPSIPPGGDVPPPPAFVMGGQQPQMGNIGTPPPFGAPPMNPVNPLGGTVAADGPNPFGFGAPPAQAAPQQPGSGGFGGGGYGQPPPGGPGPQDFGGGGGGYGPPPQQQGFPPPQQQQQQQQGGPQDWGQPPMQQQMGMGAPQGGPGMMAPYGQPQGMMPPQGQQMMGPGQHGPKGIPRSGTMELVYSFVSCGLYQTFWFYRACQEINAYLGRDAAPFWKIFLLTSVTCGLYAIYWQVTQCGVLVQEMQQRAGLQNPQNQGIMYLVPYYNVILLQEELNKVWQAPG